MRRVVAVVVLMATLISCSLGGVPQDATGEEIYAQLCSRCHGSDLSGGVVGPSLGPGSDAAEGTDEFIRFTLINGRGRMPSFSSTLSDDQVDRLIRYIREVQDEQ